MKHVPVLDDPAVDIEAEDVDADLVIVAGYSSKKPDAGKRSPAATLAGATVETVRRDRMPVAIADQHDLSSSNSPGHVDGLNHGGSPTWLP